MPLGTKRVTATQRCHVPSGWTGPSHLLRTGPPYTQPARAGGAAAISCAANSKAAHPPTMPRFMVVSRHTAAGALPSARVTIAVDSPVGYERRYRLCGCEHAVWPRLIGIRRGHAATMSVTAFQDLPLADRDRKWDGDAAEKRV